MTNQPNDDRANYVSFIEGLSSLGLVVISKTEFETLRSEVVALNTKLDNAIREGRDANANLARENDGLRHRINLLRMVLEWYANPNNWTRGTICDTFKERPGGQMAKDVLENTR